MHIQKYYAKKMRNGCGGNAVKHHSNIRKVLQHRTLYLLPEIAQHLKKVKNRQDEMRCLFGREYIKSEYIYTWDDGHLMSPEYVSRKFKEVVTAK